MDFNLSAALNSTPVTQVRFFDSIDSTNTYALRWLEEDAPDFSLVIADEQTRGRGRFDRRWVTKPASSLAFSLVLRPPPPFNERVALYAPLCALAIHDAVKRQLQLRTEIKWPNDSLVGRKKFGGVLVEALWDGGKLLGLVLGIGINVNQGSVPDSTFQSFPATCLEAAVGHPVERYLLLQNVLNAVNSWRSQMGSAAFMAQWQANLAFRGEWVSLERSTKPLIIGKIKGIDDFGRLLLLNENDEEMAVEVGDVHLRPAFTPDQGVQHAG